MARRGRPPFVTGTVTADDVVRAAVERVAFGRPVNGELLAADLGLPNRHAISRIVKRDTGQSFGEYFSRFLRGRPKSAPDNRDVPLKLTIPADTYRVLLHRAVGARRNVTVQAVRDLAELYRSAGTATA